MKVIDYSQNKQLQMPKLKPNHPMPQELEPMTSQENQAKNAIVSVDNDDEKEEIEHVQDDEIYTMGQLVNDTLKPLGRQGEVSVVNQDKPTYYH